MAVKTRYKLKETSVSTVYEYINDFPLNVQPALNKVQTTIFENAPGAEETIAYKMPANNLKVKPLVYFGAFKNHIGFYVTQPANRLLLMNYRNTSKEKDPSGLVQLWYDVKR